MAKSVPCSLNKTTLCIEKVPFFQNLQQSEKIAIVHKSHHTVYKKGEIILAENDPLNSLYIVHHGAVKIYKLYASGKEQLLRTLESGDFLGELAIFTEKTVDSYAEAIEDTEICKINRQDMHTLMLQHPQISISILEQMSKRLDATENLAGQLSTHDVESRIATYLLEKANEQHIVHLTISKRDVASYLGTTQETLSRRLKQLEDQKIITQTGQRTIHIIDMDALHLIK